MLKPIFLYSYDFPRSNMFQLREVGEIVSKRFEDGAFQSLTWNVAPPSFGVFLCNTTQLQIVQRG